jgi:putative chitinase
MNMAVFFDEVRGSLFGGRLTQAQVDGMGQIIHYRDTEYRGVTDDQLAYMLATVQWETAHTMQPIKEYGSQSYLRSKPYWPYFGRGLVQLTWKRNYERYGIAATPDKALEWPTSLKVMFDGMVRGIFTGKKLSDYINENERDYINARRIINGTDRAKEIAAMADDYRDAIIKAQDAVEPPPPPPPPPAPSNPDLQAQFDSMLIVALQTNPQVQELVRQLQEE